MGFNFSKNCNRPDLNPKHQLSIKNLMKFHEKLVKIPPPVVIMNRRHKLMTNKFSIKLSPSYTSKKTTIINPHFPYFTCEMHVVINIGLRKNKLPEMRIFIHFLTSIVFVHSTIPLNNVRLLLLKFLLFHSHHCTHKYVVPIFSI